MPEVRGPSGWLDWAMPVALGALAVTLVALALAGTGLAAFGGVRGEAGAAMPEVPVAVDVPPRP